MRMIIVVTLLVSSISLSGCTTVSGNVVPEKGPTMEQVYDSMEVTDIETEKTLPTSKTLPLHTTGNSFHKVNNPELKMYVYPHLAGKDETPVPGYYTAFNAYTQDHYALTDEY